MSEEERRTRSLSLSLLLRMCVRSNVDGGSWAELESLTAVLHIWTRMRSINHIENTHLLLGLSPRISLPLAGVTLSLSLSLFSCPGASSLSPRNVHRSCIRRIHGGLSPWRKGLGREIRGGARGSEGEYLRRALEVEFNDDVHHSLRSCENLSTYLQRASDRALSQPFIDWFAVADRTFSPKDLSTVLDRLICAWNPPAREGAARINPFFVYLTESEMTSWEI